MIRKYGGCGILPSGTYHLGLPTTVAERERNATELFAQLIKVIAVNLRGSFLVSKPALPAMKRQGGGYIVNIASTAATRAWANAAAYHASKWKLLGFSWNLGVEGRSHHIRVTTIIPGGMRTHLFERFLDQGISLPDERNLQDPANVARVILFAVTLPAGWVVQQVLVTPLSESSWPSHAPAMCSSRQRHHAIRKNDGLPKDVALDM